MNLGLLSVAKLLQNIPRTHSVDSLLFKAEGKPRCTVSDFSNKVFLCWPLEGAAETLLLEISCPTCYQIILEKGRSPGISQLFY